MNSVLNKRQIKIINILKSSKQPINSKALSEDIGCSTKTIQLEIKNINSIMNSIKIESLRGVGYNLVGDISELENIKYDLTSGDFDRISYIIKRIILLYNGNTLKIENLADEMYVSLSTIKNDLKEVKNFLKLYNLKIISKHKLGISIEGDKKNLIRCILDSSLKYSNIYVQDFFSEFVSLNIISIRNEILNKLENESIICTDHEFNNMLNYILLYLSLEDKMEYKEYIQNYINYYKDKLSQQDDKIIQDKILNSIDNFIKNLKLATSIDLSKDEIFKKYLCKHIISFCIKNDLNINNQSFIDNDIKIKYPFAFELANIAKTILEKDLNMQIDENELANIAIHIGGALQRTSNNDKTKVLKTIIVCASGIGTSMIIKAKLESKFENRLEVLKVIPSYLIDYVEIMDIDFLITTVPIEVKNIPVISISPFLDDKEISMIQKFLDTGKIYYKLNLEEIFNEDLFFVDLDFDNKYDVINYMSNKLLESNYIDEEMKNSYIEREKIATTEIGNMVAMPHGAHGKVFKNVIAIGILKDSINWDIGRVRLVVMLCFQKESLLNYDDLFSNIYKRIDSVAKVISICESKNYEKFISIFK